MTYGPKAVYLNNLAACLLKLERYVHAQIISFTMFSDETASWEEAEIAASHALKRDPKLVKARYRKALAKRGQGKYREALRRTSYTNLTISFMS